jgi:glutathione S-transferase
VLLDLLGARYDLVEDPYGPRDELASVTGGLVYVPVLVDENGKVVVESRDICEYLLARAGGRLSLSVSASCHSTTFAEGDAGEARGVA